MQEFCGYQSLVDYSPWGCKELNTMEYAHREHGDYLSGVRKLSSLLSFILFHSSLKGLCQEDKRKCLAVFSYKLFYYIIFYSIISLKQGLVMIHHDSVIRDIMQLNFTKIILENLL